MRLMTYNIWEGGTGRESDRLGDIASVIQGVGPDVIGIQEANDEKAFYGLARLLEMPHAILGHGNHGYHLALLSRWPVADWKFHAEPEIFRHGLLETHLDTPAGRLTYFVAHLSPGYSAEDEEWRVKEVEFLLKVMQPYRDGLALVAGDLNTLSPQDRIDLNDWPRQWRKQIVEQLPTEALARLVEAGYTDCYRQLHQDENYQKGYTLPATDPNVRLDYFYVSPALAARLQSCEVVNQEPANKASDHLPVRVEFDI